MAEPDELAQLAETYQDLLAAVDQARIALADGIRRASAQGRRQVEIAKVTGYTREQVRRIVAGRTR